MWAREVVGKRESVKPERLSVGEKDVGNVGKS
jgi:hypothetical protein